MLGESIGDLAGARIAFRAFEISRRGKPPLPAIDGFTPHPVAKYRAIGPLTNLPEFQQAFQCKADAPMVRGSEERCEVW